MSTTHTYWVSIGRNVGTEPMSDSDWAQFRTAIYASALRFGLVIADVLGQSEWEGLGEDTYLVLAGIPAGEVADFRDRLAWLARKYGQEAIGLVGGPGDTLVYADPVHTGDPCPVCGLETDTDKCGPLYCPGCGWQDAPCEHQLVPTTRRFSGDGFI